MRTRPEPISALLNRQRERAALDGLLEDLRSGRGRALVVRGEAGVGMSALLEHMAEAAADMRVARAAGAESEMELAFAGVHQLCAPLLDRLEGRPGPQRDALRVGFGVRGGGAPDRVLVGRGGGGCGGARGRGGGGGMGRGRGCGCSGGGGCWPSRWGWSSPRATRASSFGGWRTWRCGACRTRTPVRCWARWSGSGSMSGSGTGS